MIKKELLSKNVFLLGIALILLVPLAVNESYAETDQDLIWQLVYLKSDTCNPTDIESAKMYADLTTTYLELYQLENIGSEPNCMTMSEYENFSNDEANLVILVYIEDIGKKFLQVNDLDGLYAHVGNDRLQNHTVIVCDCSNGKASFESALTPWILSHELSHFVLSYKGYAKSTIQDAIHSIEQKYDECVAEFTTNDVCDDTKLTIRTKNGVRNFVVMKPFELAIGNNMIKYVPDEINSGVLDLQREMTNLWLLGSIDDNAYISTIKHLVDPKVDNNVDSTNPVPQIQNGFIIYEHVKYKETNWYEHLNPTNSDNTLPALLGHIQFQQTDQVESTIQEDFPNWFKTRALLWSEERISDKVFFDGLEHLVRSGTIQIS